MGAKEDLYTIFLLYSLLLVVVVILHTPNQSAALVRTVDVRIIHDSVEVALMLHANT